MTSSAKTILSSLSLSHPTHAPLLAPQLGLQPSIIPSSFTPSVAVAVAFADQPVQLGNVVRAGQAKEAPSVGIELLDGEGNGPEKYTLMLIDPDAPTPDDPKFGYWRHWVVRGLRAGGEGEGEGEGETLTRWLGPGPKDESGPHRYLFLVFREPEGFAAKKEDVGGEEFVDRRSFDAVGWTTKMGLTLVGVNWMLGVGDGWEGEV